jgi:hypothetical protein
LFTISQKKGSQDLPGGAGRRIEVIKKPISLVLSIGMNSNTIAELLGGEKEEVIYLDGGEFWTGDSRTHLATIRGEKLDVTSEGPYLERVKEAP